MSRTGQIKLVCFVVSVAALIGISWLLNQRGVSPTDSWEYYVIIGLAVFIGLVQWLEGQST